MRINFLFILSTWVRFYLFNPCILHTSLRYANDGLIFLMPSKSARFFTSMTHEIYKYSLCALLKICLALCVPFAFLRIVENAPICMFSPNLEGSQFR